MSTVAVVAHAKKSLGGGLTELRDVLASEGFPEPLWYEVSKSKKAPEYARKAVAKGANVIFVWGGDGMVQRCVDALAGKQSGAEPGMKAGTQAALAIIPAGTANLLATNLAIPADLTAAVRIGLHGSRRSIDTGTVNGEHFAVMAGAGFDALMISGASRRMKERMGRLAYVYTGARNLSGRGMRAHIVVDGEPFHSGRLSCVLIGNVGKVVGGLEVFSAARPDDGILEIGLVTANTPAQWARTLWHLAVGNPRRSRFVRFARGRLIRVRFNRPFAYELDGSDRGQAKKLRIRVRPCSVTICVPGGNSSS